MPSIKSPAPPRALNEDTIDREVVELTRATEKHRATVQNNRQYGWSFAGWSDEGSPFLAWGVAKP
jgi:hypothetical protein